MNERETKIRLKKLKWINFNYTFAEAMSSNGKMQILMLSYLNEMPSKCMEKALLFLAKAHPSELILMKHAMEWK